MPEPEFVIYGETNPLSKPIEIGRCGDYTRFGTGNVIVKSSTVIIASSQLRPMSGN
jgi:hypothetical protein